MVYFRSKVVSFERVQGRQLLSPNVSCAPSSPPHFLQLPCNLHLLFPSSNSHVTFTSSSPLEFPHQTLSFLTPSHPPMAEQVPPTPPPRPGPGPEPELEPAMELEPINPNTAIVPYRRETYVVQVPKDQIFRVPPPENAHLVEFYRSQLGKKRSPCHPFLWWFLGITLAIAAVLLLVLTLLVHLVVRIGPPTFAVERLTVKTLHNSKPEFNISLKATNPNSLMGIVHESSGQAILSSHHIEIGNGEPPAFELSYRNAATLKLLLHGSKNYLPKEVERSLQGSKDVITLALSVELPVSTRVVALTWTKNLAVECKVGAEALGREARVVWQQCETKLQ